jgi:TolA-binding protein
MPTATTPSQDTTFDASAFWIRHRSELLAGLIVLAMAAAGFAGYRLYNQRQAAAASKMLGGAKSIADYQRVIDEYPESRAGASAYLLLAVAQRDQKKFKEANATLQAFIDKFPQHELVSTAHLAMAANIESMGKPGEALVILQRLVANYPTSFIAPMAMIEEVRLLKANNQIDEARRVAENFLTQYRDSYLAGEASRQLRLMRPKEPIALSPTPTDTPVTVPMAPAAPNMPLPPNPTPPSPKP